MDNEQKLSRKYFNCEKPQNSCFLHPYFWTHFEFRLSGMCILYAMSQCYSAMTLRSIRRIIKERLRARFFTVEEILQRKYCSSCTVHGHCSITVALNLSRSSEIRWLRSIEYHVTIHPWHSKWNDGGCQSDYLRHSRWHKEVKTHLVSINIFCRLHLIIKGMDLGPQNSKTQGNNRWHVQTSKRWARMSKLQTRNPSHRSLC